MSTLPRTWVLTAIVSPSGGAAAAGATKRASDTARRAMCRADATRAGERFASRGRMVVFDGKLLVYAGIERPEGSIS
jgi:hypothetical protein